MKAAPAAITARGRRAVRGQKAPFDIGSKIVDNLRLILQPKAA